MGRLSCPPSTDPRTLHPYRTARGGAFLQACVELFLRIVAGFSSTPELGTIIIPKLQVKKLKLREIQEPRQSNSGTKACDWIVRRVSNAQSEAGLRLRGRTS